MTPSSPSDVKNESDPNWPLSSYDANDWATAFCSHFPPFDHGTAVVWFASALMRGYDEHARRFPITPDPQQEQTVSNPKSVLAVKVPEDWTPTIGAIPAVPEPKETREGEGRYEWRPLASNERIQEGDQYLDYDNGHKQNWRQVPAIAVGELVENTPIRRRAPAPQPPAEQVPSVDIVRHEREELRKANAELPERFKDAEHERDLYKKQFTHALHCVNTAFQDDYKDGCILPDYLRLGDCKFTGVIRLAKDFQRLQDERDQLAVRCKDLEKEIEIEDAANQKALKSVMNERDQLAARCKEYQEQLQDFDRMRGERDIYKRELATAKADAMKLINRNSLSIYDYNELVKRYF